MDFQFPRADQRTFVNGRTGSGKTCFGLWLLSNADLRVRPWFVFDYKLDKHIARIDRAHAFDLHERLPDHPGLYHVCPETVTDDDAVEKLLRRIWRRGGMGLYFDEGYNVPQGPFRSSFRNIMTQGRSLQIPVITVVQRPVWIDKFALSEADFYSVFHLNNREDRKRISEILPDDRVDIDQRLSEYCCHWYDVNRDWLVSLNPVPAPEVSIAAINAKLAPREKWL